MHNENQSANTDRLLWENPDQDVGYRDTVSVTENGAILMCAGGYCSGKTIKEWVELAWPKDERELHQKPDSCVCEGGRRTGYFRCSVHGPVNFGLPGLPDAPRPTDPDSPAV